MQKPAANHPSHPTGLQRTHSNDNFPSRVLVMIDNIQRELRQVHIDIYKCKRHQEQLDVLKNAHRAMSVRMGKIEQHFQHVDGTLKKFDTVLEAFTASVQHKQDFRDVARVQKTQAQELAGLRETIGMLERKAEGHRKMGPAIDAGGFEENGQATGETAGEARSEMTGEVKGEMTREAAGEEVDGFVMA